MTENDRHIKILEALFIKQAVCIDALHREKFVQCWPKPDDATLQQVKNDLNVLKERYPLTITDDTVELADWYLPQLRSCQEQLSAFPELYEMPLVEFSLRHDPLVQQSDLLQAKEAYCQPNPNAATVNVRDSGHVHMHFSGRKISIIGSSIGSSIAGVSPAQGILPTSITTRQASRLRKLLEAYQDSVDVKKDLTDEQRDELRMQLEKAKQAKSEERRKIILAVAQGFVHLASIGASIAQILGSSL